MSIQSRYQKAIDGAIIFTGPPKKPRPKTALAYYFFCREKGYTPFDAFLVTMGIFSKSADERKDRYLRMCRSLNRKPRMYL